jgi:hypothetical protein
MRFAHEAMADQRDSERSSGGHGGGKGISERVHRAQEQTRPPVAAWLSLVCLDAPLVAFAWQQLFARALRVQTPAAATVALCSTAWLIYSADRFADSRTVPANAPRSLRQRFARQHPAVLVSAIASAAITTAMSLPRLDFFILQRGAIVGAAAIVYLVINQFLSRLWRVLPLKEITVGLLFAAGVCSSIPAPIHSLGWNAALFGLLCVVNCISIAVWEQEIDRRQCRSSLATRFPRMRFLPLVASIALATLACAASRNSNDRATLGCIAASALLLAVLNDVSRRIGTDTCTALADIALLTPLAVLPFLT